MENASQLNDADEYVIPCWRQIMWSTLFTIISVIGFVGNFTIIWIVAAHQNMRTVTHLFLVNLAIADGLVALFDVPFVSFQSIYGYWPFGHFMCILNEFFAVTNIGVSIMTLSMISIDRYQAIMYPLKRRMGRRKTITIMVAIWLVSIMIFSPNWIYIITVERIVLDGGVVCGQLWPNHTIEEIYRICVMIVLYFVPLGCIGFNYGSLGAKLWSYEAIGEQSQCQLRTNRTKKKIVKMLVTVVSVFAVCWLPYHIIFIAIAADLLTPVYFREIRLAVFWMAMSNAMCNPIIYWLMNSKFRTGFKKAYDGVRAFIMLRFRRNKIQ